MLRYQPRNTSEQIDDFMSSLSEMGVSVVDSAEGVGDDENAEDGRAAGNLSDSDVSGTDDPAACIYVKWKCRIAIS